MQKNLSRVYSGELEGIRARRIEVETDIHAGLHSFTLVGLADKALNEAKERVNSAIKNSGMKPPNRENRKITVNLAPADIKKTGSHYDFAIAIGYLLATEQVAEFNAEDKMFIGELALDGHLRGIRGALNIAHMAKELGYAKLFVPKENANEAAAISGIDVIPVDTLEDAVQILEGRREGIPARFSRAEHAPPSVPDFSEIKSQEFAKRALTIAAAGSHNLLMIGPPGVGKSLLAQALIGILPSVHEEEAIEITKIYSAAGQSPNGLIETRPFRSPHQTASLISVVGGGSTPRPGEISLAHRGILFLDELPEFPKNILEALRGPMESGVVHVARAKDTLAFPAKFSLIAAMNPCPCGFHGDEEKECKCTAYEVIRYNKKISGPLMDRIDLQIRIPRVRLATLREKSGEEGVSPKVKAAVDAARKVQAERFARLRIRTNAEMSAKQAEEFSLLTNDAEEFLKSLDTTKLSPRAYYRLLKTARTIADIETSERVTAGHLSEAFGYRLKENI